MIKFNGQNWKDEEFFAGIGLVGIGVMIIVLAVMNYWNG